MSELKACKKCNNYAKVAVLYNVHCDTCGINTGWVETLEEATSNWNKSTGTIIPIKRPIEYALQSKYESAYRDAVENGKEVCRLRTEIDRLWGLIQKQIAVLESVDSNLDILSPELDKYVEQRR
jgi:hypothetical protein